MLPALTGLGNLRLITGGGQDAACCGCWGIGPGGEGTSRCAISGGMRRRVAIARALAADYELPCWMSRSKAWTRIPAPGRLVIRRYSHGKTVVLVTHDRMRPS